MSIGISIGKWKLVTIKNSVPIPVATQAREDLREFEVGLIHLILSCSLLLDIGYYTRELDLV